MAVGTSPISLCACWLLLLLIAAVGVTSGQEPIVRQLDNGCTETRMPENTTAEHRPWWTMPYPHLNCSGRGKTRFRVTGARADVASITFGYNQLLQFHVDDLAPFTKLAKLEFRMNRLQQIVPSSTNLTLNEVAYISFSNNLLVEIPNLALKSFPNLSSLTMNGNRLTRMYSDDFRYNSQLKYIYLGPNPFEQPLNTAWLKTLDIGALSIKSSGLTSLPKELASLSNLYFADFSSNAITSIRSNTFTNCSTLRWITFAGNQITTVEDNAFMGATSLRSIELSDNRIVTLAPEAFAGVNMEEMSLELYENPIRCDCDMARFKTWSDQLIEHDPATEILYKCYQPSRNHGRRWETLQIGDFTCLSNDPLYQACDSTQFPTLRPPVTSPSQRPPPISTECPTKCVCYDENGKQYPADRVTAAKKRGRWSWWQKQMYPRIDCIDSNYREIPTTIRRDVKMILMKGNQIKDLYVNDLRQFTQLQSLNLKGNGIVNIIADPQTVLRNVTMLNLRYNNLTSIRADVMRSFPNVTTLALYHNQITSFPVDLFTHNRVLNRLYLGPNPVRQFNDGFLTGLSLQSLSLRNLSIKAVPSHISTMVNLSYCDLSDNLITTIRNRTFSRLTKLYRLTMENNKISRIESGAFNGAISMRSVILSENQLSTLPGNVFSNISDERVSIELWENQFVCNCSLKPFKTWIESMNALDPSTDIRFRCVQPLRMHNKLSDQLAPNDFTCEKHEKEFVVVLDEQADCGGSVKGQMALAVLITFLTTLLLCAILWRVTLRRKYGHLLRYAKQRGDDYDGIVPEEY